MQPELPRVLDSTLITSLRLCAYKGFLSNILHKEPSGVSRVPLTAGGAFAAGVEEYRIAHYLDKQPAEECLHRAILAATIRWGENDIMPTERKNPHLLEARTLDRICYAIQRYFAEYPPSIDNLQPQPSVIEGRTGFEYSVAMPLEPEDGFPLHPSGEPFLYHIRADTLGTYRGIPCFSDEKTTGQLGQTWAEQWPLRNQFMGYAWVFRQLGMPHRRVVVRGVCILKEKLKFIEHVQHYPNPLLDAFEQSLRHTVHMMVHYHNQGYWPQEFGEQCNMYNGCDWRNLCLAPRNMHKMLIARYAEREWRPDAPHEPVKLIAQWRKGYAEAA